MLPDLESLRCFEKAAVVLNFRLAASAVGLSPAAFGDRIRRLEDQIGEQLFQRTTRSVALTAVGQRLLVQARRTLEEARRCLVLEPGPTTTPFELTIGTRFELGLSWLAPSLRELRTSRPERTLHLYFGDSEELLTKVRKGRIDCAVSSVRLAGGNVRYELLYSEAYVLVGEPRLIAENSLRRSEDAHHHNLLDIHPDLPLFRYLLDARPPGERWDFRGTEYLGTIGAVRYRALEGAGVAVLPRYFVESDLQSGALVRLLPRATLHDDYFRLIWRGGHEHEEEIRRLARDLRRIPLR
jgi:LysR family glycine cleavage system transcriptional activator